MVANTYGPLSIYDIFRAECSGFESWVIKGWIPNRNLYAIAGVFRALPFIRIGAFGAQQNLSSCSRSLFISSSCSRYFMVASKTSAA